MAATRKKTAGGGTDSGGPARAMRSTAKKAAKRAAKRTGKVIKTVVENVASKVRAKVFGASAKKRRR